MSERNDIAAGATEQNIEELQERYKKLDKRKTEAETHLRIAKQELEKLQKEAREKYGTDDVVQLREKLAEMNAENAKRRREYQESLDQIENDLKEVERKFAANEKSDDVNGASA